MASKWLFVAALVCMIVTVQSSDEDKDPIEVCSSETVCNCTDDGEVRTLLCDEVYFMYDQDGNEIDDPLRTTNVLIHDTSFLPTHAYFRHNQIAVLEKGKILPKAEKELIELDLSYNRIYRTIDKPLEDMKSLSILRLSHNRLKKIASTTFVEGSTWKLTELYLDYNNLTTIDSNAFDNMDTLQKLVLNGNEHLNLEKEIFSTSLSHLRSLFLDNCNIRSLGDDIFSKLTSLEELSLRENPLADIPKALQDIPSLTILDLSYIRITELHANTFQYNKKLEQISFDNDAYLYCIHGAAFCGLESLQSLILSNTSQLYDISTEAFACKDDKDRKLPTLTLLNVENSNLSTIGRNLFKTSDDTNLMLGGNPWSCNCDLAWIVANSFDLNQGIKTPTCKKPAELAERRLNSLTSAELCPREVRITRLFISLFVLVFASLIAVILYYLVTNYRIHNIFYRPDLPHIGYSNLSRAEEEENARKDQQLPIPADV